MSYRLSTAIPLSEINKDSVNDKTGPYGQLSNLHMWWSRSPLSSTMSIMNMVIEDAEQKRSSAKPDILDPFSGFGIIPLVAGGMGLEADAIDLNPVAVMISKAVAEIPALFKDCKAINPSARRKSYLGAEGLSEDLRYYGDLLLDKAKEKLILYYPSNDSTPVAAWLWVRTVQCPNPACACQMPLSASYVLDGKKGQETWAEPVVERGQIRRFILHKGKCPKERESNKQGTSGAQFQCPVCGTITTADYIKNKGAERKIGAHMVAVVCDTESGRIYVEPNVDQVVAAEMVPTAELPAGSIPKNAHWFSPPGYGMNEFADLFSARQAYMLCTFSDLIKEVRLQCIKDAVSAGMKDDTVLLSNGGCGSTAYADAISVYLAFVVDRMTDYHSTICSWRKAGGNLRSTFGRQAIPMVWNYAEANPFSDITGNYSGILKGIADVVAKLPCEKQARIKQGNAVTMDWPENRMIISELPYYRNVGYADLSDYFYIWLRRSLKDLYPELFQSMVTPKEELSTVCQYYGVPATEARENYIKQLGEVCRKIFASQNENYPALLFYEFHKGDLVALQNDVIAGGSQTPWEILLEILLKEGFGITATWPMRSEKYSDKADATRVLIVCEKGQRLKQATRRSFVNTLKNEMESRLNEALHFEVDECDKLIAGLGSGLKLFSEYKRIMNADGTDMNIHDALQLIYIEIQKYITENSEGANKLNTSEEVSHAGEL